MSDDNIIENENRKGIADRLEELIHKDDEEKELGLFRNIRSQFMAILVGTIAFFTIVPIITNNLQSTLGISLKTAFTILVITYFLGIVGIALIIFLLGKERSLVKLGKNKNEYIIFWLLMISLFIFILIGIGCLKYRGYYNYVAISKIFSVLILFLLLIFGYKIYLYIKQQKVYSVYLKDLNKNEKRHVEIQKLKNNLFKEFLKFFVLTSLLFLLSYFIIKKNIRNDKDVRKQLDKSISIGKAFNSFLLSQKIDELNSDFKNKLINIKALYYNKEYNKNAENDICSVNGRNEIEKSNDSLIKKIHNLNLLIRNFIDPINFHDSCYKILFSQIKKGCNDQALCRISFETIGKTTDTILINRLYKNIRKYCNELKYVKSDKSTWVINEGEKIINQFNRINEENIKFKSFSNNYCGYDSLIKQQWDQINEYNVKLRELNKTISLRKNPDYFLSKLKNINEQLLSTQQAIKDNESIDKYNKRDITCDIDTFKFFYDSLVDDINKYSDRITQKINTNKFDSLFLVTQINILSENEKYIFNTKSIIDIFTKKGWTSVLNYTELAGFYIFLGSLIILFLLWFIIYRNSSRYQFEVEKEKNSDDKKDAFYYSTINSYFRSLDLIKSFITIIMILIIPIFRPFKENEVNLENPFWAGKNIFENPNEEEKKTVQPNSSILSGEIPDLIKEHDVKVENRINTLENNMEQAKNDINKTTEKKGDDVISEIKKAGKYEVRLDSTSCKILSRENTHTNK